MNAPPQSEQTSNLERENCIAAVKSKRVIAAAWLAGVTAVVALNSINSDASLGAGLAVIGVSTMVAVVCYLILKDK